MRRRIGMVMIMLAFVTGILVAAVVGDDKGAQSGREDSDS